jgi:FlaG/FlaF family flagellin (archaellin)
MDGEVMALAVRIAMLVTLAGVFFVLGRVTTPDLPAPDRNAPVACSTDRGTPLYDCADGHPYYYSPDDMAWYWRVK